MEQVIASVTREGEFLVQSKINRKSDDSDDENKSTRNSTGSNRSNKNSKGKDDGNGDGGNRATVSEGDGAVLSLDPKVVQSGGTFAPKRTAIHRKPSLWGKLCQCFSKTSQYRAAKKSRSALSSEHHFVLKPLSDADQARGLKTLVLDLDETLVHASFQPVEHADFVISVEIDGLEHAVYVCKRPHVDEFLEHVGSLFEVVVFTASLSKYANPVLDLLDVHKVVSARLYRQHCVEHLGNFVKDLSVLGRELSRTLIIDNAPPAYIFQQENGFSCSSWFDDPTDTELLDFIPILEEIADSKVDVRKTMKRVRNRPLQAKTRQSLAHHREAQMCAEDLTEMLAWTEEREAARKRQSQQALPLTEAS